MGWKDRIAIDPAVQDGKPTVKGTSISVEFVVDLLASGCTSEVILRENNQLTMVDFLACLSYASEVLKSEHFDRINRRPTFQISTKTPDVRQILEKSSSLGESVTVEGVLASDGIDGFLISKTATHLSETSLSAFLFCADLGSRLNRVHLSPKGGGKFTYSMIATVTGRICAAPSASGCPIALEAITHMWGYQRRKDGPLKGPYVVDFSDANS